MSSPMLWVIDYSSDYHIDYPTNRYNTNVVWKTKSLATVTWAAGREVIGGDSDVIGILSHAPNGRGL